MELNNTRDLLRDDVYSNMAKEISRLSKDENTHIGAVIVANDGTPISWGYNGTISGFDDSIIPHSREQEELIYSIKDDATNKSEIHFFKSNKYPYMSHAESNAIFYANKDKLIGSTIYVTGFPCDGCALQIARAKIARVVVISDSNVDSESSLNTNNHNALFIFAQQGIKLTVNKTNYTLKCHKSETEN